MARSSMADLITQVRELIADEDGATFSDDTVQTALDATRLSFRYRPLVAEITYPSRVATYLTYETDETGWEQEYEITDHQYEPVADDGDSEPLLGKFRFTASQEPPLYISGHAYDAYAAAADLLERWAAKVALDFDFSTDSGSFSRNQKQATLREMARVYRAQAKPVFHRFRRDDEDG